MNASRENVLCPWWILVTVPSEENVENLSLALLDGSKAEVLQVWGFTAAYGALYGFIVGFLRGFEGLRGVGLLYSCEL